MKTQPPTQPAAQINAQTQGPIRNDGFGNFTAPDGTIVASAHGPNLRSRHIEKVANSRLLAASFTAFDKAGRTLGVDAAELAERIDLAALILASQKLRAMVSNVLTDSQLDTPQLGGARAKCARTIRDALEPLERVLGCVKPR